MTSRMSIFDACMIADGAQDAQPSAHLEAYALLIQTGVVWQLQGTYGRNAAGLIQAGLISPTGEIDYDAAEEAGYLDDLDIEIGDDGEPVAYYLED